MVITTLHINHKMFKFRDFLEESKKGKVSLYRFGKHRAVKSPSPYWSGVSRKRTRIGGMTYTTTYKYGKPKFTKRMRTLIGKKR